MGFPTDCSCFCDSLPSESSGSSESSASDGSEISEIEVTCGDCEVLPLRWSAEIIGDIDNDHAEAECCPSFPKTFTLEYTPSCLWQDVRVFAQTDDAFGPDDCDFVDEVDQDPLDKIVMYLQRTGGGVWQVIAGMERIPRTELPAGSDAIWEVDGDFNCLGVNTFSFDSDSGLCDWSATSVKLTPA